jgi:hypothetical protein
VQPSLRLSSAVSTLSLVLAWGCGSTQPHADPSPTVTASGSAPPLVSASTPRASSSAVVEAPPPHEKQIVVATEPNATDVDAAAPGAKCDFSRSYRGKIGETPVSLVLHVDAKDGSVVTGLSHYDREGDAISVRGKADGTTFTLDESPGGTFAGTCDPATGILTGTFTLGKAATPFTLNPRPSDWPGLYVVTKQASAESHDPACLGIAKPNEPVAVSDWGVCPPSDPKKRKEFYKDAPDLGCSIKDISFRVFGMTDKGVEKKVNATLGLTPFDGELRSINACPSTPMNAWYNEFIVRLSGGLLVTETFRSEYSGGAHPMNSNGEPTTIDLTTGEVVRLEDAVGDLGKLKGAAAKCVALYNTVGGDVTRAPVPAELPEAKCGSDGGMAVFLWGCAENPRPSLAILSEGVVIAQSGNPHVSAVMDGWGPIIPWSILLRDGVVPSESPIARLWKDAAKAGPTDLPCTSAYEGDTWRSWHVE